MVSTAPKISVCIPTYNQARYLGLAIRSALEQTERDIEVIVFDDASTDDTPGVVASFGDPRLRGFRQARNVGIARNRNSCLSVARGRYLAWLDGDDIYRPEMLALQSALLDRSRRVGLVHGNHDVIGEDGRTLPAWPPPFTEDTIEPGLDAFRELILSNYVTTSTVLVRRECYDRVGTYAAELARSGEDWELWLRIALRFDIAYTVERVASYRQHPASSSNETVASGERVRLDMAAVDRILDPRRGQPIPNVTAVRRRAEAALAFKALVHAGSAFAAGNRSEALRAVLLALSRKRALARKPAATLLVLNIILGREYANYRHSRALLGQLHRELHGSRFADRIRKLSVPDPAWEQSVRDVARVVRHSVPSGARVAVVDKHDPTLLHLCGRKGWHFPDLQILPGGYPRDSAAAVEHLESLRRRGARYIVFPSHAYWWLDHYQGLADHLETAYAPIWRDDSCRIYALAGREAA